MRRDAPVVFLGPTLDRRAAEGLLDATYLPPVKRGDLRSLPPAARAVAIIDGEFHQSLAVAPKEVLALIETGIPVYGSSSMGALRAAELHRLGMIGIGSVFRLFRRGVLDADDEVALAYCPESFRPLSEPLVDTRYALRVARRARLLSAFEGDAIIGELKAAYFPDRTRELFRRIARNTLGEDRARALGHFVVNNGPGIKERDAKRLLARMRHDLST